MYISSKFNKVSIELKLTLKFNWGNAIEKYYTVRTILKSYRKILHNENNSKIL
jgi:hypothetical protein